LAGLLRMLGPAIGSRAALYWTKVQYTRATVSVYLHHQKL
jgi:hypothetical protein